MDHNSFRYYIPGVIFLLPIYFVICYYTIKYNLNSDVRVFVLLGGITTFPVISLPVGWWIYNAYRVWWIFLTKGGYERKVFIHLIRKDTKPFYSPLTKSILIDFTHVKGIEHWMQFDPEVFRQTFCPYTSKKRFDREIRKSGIHLKFSEALSDFILFNDKGYDYARSISSVRYSMESSSFALILSIIYALLVKVIWSHNLTHGKDDLQYFISVFIFFLITCVLLVTLFIRWRFANQEYDARLILTTLTSVSKNFFDVKELKSNIPDEIADKIEKLVISGNPYAAFDLDNTLLIDDIGEAVFAMLIREKLITEFSWKEYLILLEQDRETAYREVVEVMNGMELNVLERITCELLDTDESIIEVEGYEIPIPRPNPVMQSVISMTMARGIETYIVTASNKVSAEIICWRYFGIPAKNILGVPLNTDRNGRISLSFSYFPFAEGKVELLKKMFHTKPLITGGDGIWDKHLLDYTNESGIRLWLGEDKIKYQELKEADYSQKDFFHVEREATI